LYTVVHENSSSQRSVRDSHGGQRVLPSSTILSLSLSIQSTGVRLFVATGLRFVKKCVFYLDGSGRVDARSQSSRLPIVIGTHIKFDGLEPNDEFNSPSAN